MNIPRPLSDRMAAIEGEIRGIQDDANKRITPLRAQLDALEFAVSVFADAEKTPAVAAPPTATATPFGDEISTGDRIVALLTNARKPMSATEIVEALSRHGIPRNTVSARLSLLAKDGRISHEGVGQWAVV